MFRNFFGVNLKTLENLSNKMQNLENINNEEIWNS